MVKKRFEIDIEQISRTKKRLIIVLGRFGLLRNTANRKNTERNKMSSSQYLTSTETLKRLPFGKTKFWKDIASGDFPEPIRIGSRCYWLETQVEEYLAALEKEAADRQEAKRLTRSANPE